MKNIIFIFSFIFICLSAQAQTKLISHKSHSGSKATFRTALDANLFDIGTSNFGEPGWFSSPVELDSIVHVNDSTALVYRRSATLADWESRDDKKTWQPSIDTLINHPLFSQKHGLQNIRTKMRQYYEFRNWVDDVKFVGYDDEMPEGEKSNPTDVKTTPQQSYTPINVKEPKECKKPIGKPIEKVEENTNQAPKDNNKTSYHIEEEKPKPVFVSNQAKAIPHTTETVKEASTIKESQTSGVNNILMAVLGLVFLPILLGFLFLKKS